MRTQEVYPRPPNILHLPRIWVKCTCVGGKSTPKLNEKDNFHKALPNVKKAYVTLRKFTPDLKIFYTDISAISVPLCNSGWNNPTKHCPHWGRWTWPTPLKSKSSEAKPSWTRAQRGGNYNRRRL